MLEVGIGFFEITNVDTARYCKIGSQNRVRYPFFAIINLCHLIFKRFIHSIQCGLATTKTELNNEI